MKFRLARPARLLIALVIIVILALLLTQHYSKQIVSSNRCPTPVASSDYQKVPNKVHFIHLDSEKLSFVAFICISAAFLHQKPDQIIIHTNRVADLKSDAFYLRLKDRFGDAISLQSAIKPTHVFGAPLGSVSHAADVLRLQLLLE